MSFCIEEELKKLPASPGVYLMHGQSDEIIYVGKAVSLKNRVKQYFQPGRDKRPMIGTMVPQISRFEYIVTDSELEALILECNLIKEYRPKYNTLLKDDKSYPYIRVTLEEDYPRVLFSRNMKKNRSRYFGPYTGAFQVKDTVELVRKLYCLRNCSLKLPAEKKDRPCLYYHIGQCKAPCQGWISKEEYKKQVDEAIEFLSGNHMTVIKGLTDKMMKASEEMRFEEAAKYRDLIESVRKTAETQKASLNNGEECDIVALARDGEEIIAQIFFMRGGKLIGREHYYLKTDTSSENRDILKDFILQFYSGTPYVPKELMISEEPEDVLLLEEYLSEKKKAKVHIKIPQKGKKEKLVELAVENAKNVLDHDRDRIRREEASTTGAIKDLGKLISINTPVRIEAYDISNISGFQSVGSMVVFENGKPKRQDYRKFKIKSVEGPNDYASLKEVLLRRFTRAAEKSEGFDRLPDLILMDGGKGQVNICLEALGEMNLDIPVCGMVKDDKHRTRGLFCDNIEVPMDRNSEVFRLVTRVQDEAHRFAITYHRLLRSKGQIHSVLDDIEGVGPQRRKELMKHYTGTEDIRSATVEELQQLPSMNKKAAQAVFDFFHSEHS